MNTLLNPGFAMDEMDSLLCSESDGHPFRKDLYSVEVLQRHARHLAQKHRPAPGKGPNLLLPRLASNEKLLRDYNEATLRAEKTRRITPAGEWLLDNFHLIEEQIRTARRHLPRSFSRELPHLKDGSSAQYPRVYELALELISHVDGRIDAVHLSAFVAAYQEVSALKLGELWAFPIMLRLALIENLRRVAALLSGARKERDAADEWAEEMLKTAETDPSRMIIIVGRMAQAIPKLSQPFVAEFWRRAQEKSPRLKVAVSWMEERLAEQHVAIEELVLAESRSQAANQISVGNSIGSLRFLDSMDWREFVETQSVVESALRGDPAQVYPSMDFATRDTYRHTVERIAKGSGKTELEVANAAINLSRQHDGETDARLMHVGHYLIGNGLDQMEEICEYKPSPMAQIRKFGKHHPLLFYAGGILVLSFAITLGILQWAAAAACSRLSTLFGLGVLLMLCASQLGISIVNWLSHLFVAPKQLPKLDFSKGLSAEHATMVTVPTMLTSVDGIDRLLETLEVHYLANRDPHIFFSLLTDFRDAPQEFMPSDDELVHRAMKGVHALNKKYRHDRPCIFFLFHRPRLWNEQDQVWMGYERKRGKLADLNRCLRGGSSKCFSHISGDLSQLPRIQYVITLDTDTQLPRDAAQQLAATMAHPLNRPRYDSSSGIVVDGYSILQPRVAVSLPSSGKSHFVKLFSGDPGLDPYTRTVSDVYQDVFKEGSFIGKGIYDVDAFELAVSGKFPENRILSHDLLEGSYARSALVTDVQLFEDYPSRYSTDTKRRHRWIRGDWQIATWLLPRLPGLDVRRVKNPLSDLSRWKIFDNLRRSLVPPAMVISFALGWLLFPAHALTWSLIMVGMIAFPSVLAVVSDLVRKPKEMPVLIHLKSARINAVRHAGQAFLAVSFLPYDACISLDAVIRTIVRLLLTHKKLLEWQTSSDTEDQRDGGLGNFFLTMWHAPTLAIVIGVLLAALGFSGWSGVLPFLLLWAFAPAVAWWISQPLAEDTHRLTYRQIQSLHVLSRKTWRFFETFVGPEDNWLPPDNLQEYPKLVLATRTSPTNIGLAMLCTLSAYDFGYLTLDELARRLRETLNTLRKLERYEGHFYNWYDTRSLAPLPPLYLSTVDNGNFMGLLLTLHSGLLEAVEEPWSSKPAAHGLQDTYQAWMDYATQRQQNRQPASQQIISRMKTWGDHLKPQSQFPSQFRSHLASLAGSFAALADLPETQTDPEFAWWQTAIERMLQAQRNCVDSHYPWLVLEEPLHNLFSRGDWGQLEKIWHDSIAPQSLRTLINETPVRLSVIDNYLPVAQQRSPEAHTLLTEFRKLLVLGAQQAGERLLALEKLAEECDSFARMDFTMLYDHARELFSIGYNVHDHRLDASCYDLLASEARLASYAAISLGQLPQRHWFTLGRLLTMTEGHPALISWSGSMFEYLMPMLVMPSYENTLIDLSCRSAVLRQIEYGKQRGVPWGVSESGYNLRDTLANYQYRAFGVPGLGFKRGLAEDVVIAPYATLMSLMITPEEACNNLDRLREMGAEGAYGFYEALDFTPSRVPRGQDYSIIQSFMAHHHGMSLLALAYTLHDRPMQRRFNANPLFKSSELLLHERVPKESSVLYPHELEASTSRENPNQKEVTLRVFRDPNSGPPEVHLLSNNRYHVVVTNSGGGYSHWNGTALTRWRDDVTRDCWGTFFYLRDRENGQYWSAAHQPTFAANSSYEAIFSQGRAEFRSLVNDIESHTEISVSPEDDVEVRRVTLTNRSRTSREIELTTYAEVVLNTMAADLAHPAFSNLFIQTQIIPERNAIICTRRARKSGEQLPVMFHLLLHDGNESGTTSYETDRSLFLGRGRDTSAPLAMHSTASLANSEGSVLDPIISIRRAVRLARQESVHFTFVSGVAADRESLDKLMEKYQDQTIADRCFELAWTHGLVVLRHLNATETNAQLYGRLAGALLYSQGTHRAPAAVISSNRKGQRNLWSFGISGDLPIIVVKSRHAERLDLIREVVQAHAYWRMKGLLADLVILNQDDSVYRQSLHDQILTFVASSNAAQLFEKPGGIFTRRLDQLSSEDLVLLETSARVVLSDERGTLAKQLDHQIRPVPLPPLLTNKTRALSYLPVNLPQRELIFFNGLGGFTPDGREYVITLRPGQMTPAPWSNVLSNAGFGTLITESGGAYTWSENCHELRLTPWSNDPVADTNGEAFFIRDEATGNYWSPTPLPASGKTPYVTRHGFGYSVFEHQEEGISSELWVYVATDRPVKLARLKLRNHSAQSRTLSAYGYWEWVMGEFRHRNAMHIATEFDVQANTLFARNPYNLDFPDRAAFVTCSEPVRSFTADRIEFLGRNRGLSSPAALERVRLGGKSGLALDPCGALQILVHLAPGQEREVYFTLGCAENTQQARQLAETFQKSESGQHALEGVWDYWNRTLGTVYFETPEPSLNVLANGWLLYQVLSCRLWARTGLYQSGGAFGFRDQLQDAMALVHAEPRLLREQLLRAAAHQFREGDVQHWWHPPHNRGVRTHFSDDYLWLPYALSRYVETTGDTGVMDVQVPFIEGRPLKPEEEAYYDTPNRSSESASLYEHAVRAVRNGFRYGDHGLPLIGCGDWNDGMNMIGEHGKGESVWLAFFLYDVLKHFAPLARLKSDLAFEKECDEQAKRLQANIESNAWDGQWYRRAYFDDGEPLGSALNPECQIDALPQSWAVLSQAGDPERCRTALEAVQHRLVRREAKLIQLFDPPFDKSHLEPGYIKGYVPGVRENGGQYTHAAIWTVMAFAQAGDIDRAWELFSLINPVLHTDTSEKAARYKVEPYVVAADVYSVPPHTGRGGWTWYTGSAGWMYRLITETLLGVNLEIDKLHLTPRVPSSWKSYRIHYRYRNTVYHIDLINRSNNWNGQQTVIMNGGTQADAMIRLIDDGRNHQVEVIFN
ncbi:MAG TPA: glucoamylase family protein [Verrucomicrobiae bacterium]